LRRIKKIRKRRCNNLSGTKNYSKQGDIMTTHAVEDYRSLGDCEERPVEQQEEPRVYYYTVDGVEKAYVDQPVSVQFARAINSVVKKIVNLDLEKGAMVTGDVLEPVFGVIGGFLVAYILGVLFVAFFPLSLIVVALFGRNNY